MKKSVDINDIQKEVEEDIIDQRDKIDPSVEAHLQEMGFLWDRVHTKLKEDNICFSCKNILVKDDEKKEVFVLEANQVEKGVIAFVSVCKDCKLKLYADLKDIKK